MRRLLLLALPVLCVGQAPVITPSSPPIVKQGQTYTFSATNGPITWSVSGSGSINSSTGVYTPPAATTPKQRMGGCQMLPNDHIYNTDISGLSVHASSATWITSLLGPSISIPAHGDFPVQSVLSTDSTTAMSFYYSPSANGNFILPPYPELRLEGGYNTYRIDADHHSIQITRDTCRVYETYQLYPAGYNLDCLSCNSQSGTQYDALTYDLGNGTDAAGMKLAPLLIREEELVAGAINHALRFTFCAGCINTGSHVWPGTATSSVGPCTTNCAPYGSRMRLKSSVDISGWSARGQVIGNALKTYGAFIADVGLNGALTSKFETYSAASLTAFSEVSGLDTNDFEFVDESSLRVSDTSGITTSPAVVVTATGAGGSATQNVALQGLALGTTYQNQAFQASAPQTQLGGWITGDADTSGTWSMSPTVGSLTSGGLYTPPASVASPTNVTFTLTSVADGTKTITLPATVWPTGVIRIDAGNASNYTDGSSNVWYGDFNTALNSYGVDAGYAYDFGTDSWTGTSSGRLFRYLRVTLADLIYRFIVPPGTYSVTFMFADQASANQRKMGLETQGTILNNYYDVTDTVGANTAVSVPLTATVTSTGQLQLAVRHQGIPPGTPNACCNETTLPSGFSLFLSALTIEQTAGPANTTTSGARGGAILGGGAIR